MKKYFLFDKIIQSDKTSSFATAAKTLIALLEIDAIPFKDAKADVGSEMLGLDKMKFYERNAYTLSLASIEQRDILCFENSSFTSLWMTKEALLNDEDLKNIIAQRLSKSNIVLNLSSNILTLETVLEEEIGFGKLKTMVKHPFAKFSVALFLGTSTCRAKKHTDTALSETLLDLVGAKRIAYASAYESDGFEVLDISTPLAYGLASKAMLDMFDNAADFVVVTDARSLVMFDFYQKALEKNAQREIELSVLSLAQVLLLAFGVVDKKSLGLDQHKVPATLI